jgi:uncharacterized protein YbjT (DUF2867 family)
MPSPHPIVIVGGNSLVAPWLCQRLAATGQTAHVISRSPAPVPDGFSFNAMDLSTSRNWIAPENATILSLLPLWTLTEFLPRFIGVRSITALGSTSLFSKADSGDEMERKISAQLDNAEKIFHSWCTRSNVRGALLRPTMIYDCKRDGNITRMANFIRRFRFLVLADPARGLRQPIHADDVADAMLRTIDNDAVAGKTLNIAGGEVLTYRAMAERVFNALHIKPRIIMLPEALLRTSFSVVSHLGLVKERSFGGSIFQRMNQNLVFDNEEGKRLLDYKARVFWPEFGA